MAWPLTVQGRPCLSARSFRNWFENPHRGHGTVRTSEVLGRLIRQERKRQRLRQADLAAMIGASHVFLADVEKGKPTVQLGRVLKLLDELGLVLTVDAPDSERPTSVQATTK